MVEFTFTPNAVPVITTIMGLFLVLFGLSSAVVKERLYLSEAVLTTLIGSLVGPHVLALFVPQAWPDLNSILLETSRLVIAMQIMAAVVCLPVQYYKIHWKSIAVLLVPVMTASWLVSAGIVYWLLPVTPLLALAIGGTLAPTDPILANSIVKGRFADRHVPRHVRHLLSGESACNDSTAALFIQLPLLLIKYNSDAGHVTFDFFIWVVLYEMIVGAVYGVIIGYAARRALKYAEEHDLIDQENFLSFAIALSIFIDGSSLLLHLNDFVAVLTGAIAFSWDGSFYEVTKTSQIQEVLDNLANAWFFVFNGAIIPWPQIFNGSIAFWRYVVTALLILILRRIPVTAVCYKVLPSLTNIKEAMFVGHFGPIAAGAIYYMAFVRNALNKNSPPIPDVPDSLLYPELEPIVSFMVVASILVHGCTVPMFKLGTVAVRTLSAGSSLGRRSRSIGRASTTPRAPLSGVFSVSAPINARPLYGPGTVLAANADSLGSAAGAALLQEAGMAAGPSAGSRGVSADLLRKSMVGSNYGGADTDGGDEFADDVAGGFPVTATSKFHVVSPTTGTGGGGFGGGGPGAPIPFTQRETTIEIRLNASVPPRAGSPAIPLVSTSVTQPLQLVPLQPIQLTRPSVVEEDEIVPAPAVLETGYPLSAADSQETVTEEPSAAGGVAEKKPPSPL
ncbi:Na+/H+ antiporter [Blastocladiella emersonii ATCC 22665]|nr:Na+/H+ antiporter [Blastocladiella emersonii ATCC 22665]